MDQQQEQLESIKAIRSMMERSSRFLSLSGLSGVIVGLMAIVGVFIAYAYLGLNIDEPGYYNKIIHPDGSLNNEVFQFLLIEMIVLLVIALATAILLTRRNASATSGPMWAATAIRGGCTLVVPL
jgi:predicted lysophospholipase L1 biosynthesis ABC-type transport system permease subunit